jgi:apolipoprotein N-acyltransferase
MFFSPSLFYALLLGFLTSLVASSSSAGWWQMLTLAFFWRLTHQHFYHGTLYQAKLGWCFGFAYFCHGLWWIYVSLHDVGGMPFWMASGGVILLAAFLAFFPSLACF